MSEARATFAGMIRSAARFLGAGGARFDSGALSNQAGIQTYEDNKRMHAAIRDMCKSGELERVERGVYVYKGRNGKKPQKQVVMWRFFRLRKTVTIEDLQEVSESSADYAEEWLKRLLKMGVAVRCGNGKYQLIKDTVDMPEYTEKAEKLRALRECRKLQAKELLKRIREDADTVERIMGELGEPDAKAETPGEEG